MVGLCWTFGGLGRSECAGIIEVCFCHLCCGRGGGGERQWLPSSCLAFKGLRKEPLELTIGSTQGCS